MNRTKGVRMPKNLKRKLLPSPDVEMTAPAQPALPKNFNLNKYSASRIKKGMR
jgi:hypothetical protein